MAPEEGQEVQQPKLEYNNQNLSITTKKVYSSECKGLWFNIHLYLMSWSQPYINLADFFLLMKLSIK